MVAVASDGSGWMEQLTGTPVNLTGKNTWFLADVSWTNHNQPSKGCTVAPNIPVDSLSVQFIFTVLPARALGRRGLATRRIRMNSGPWVQHWCQPWINKPLIRLFFIGKVPKKVSNHDYWGKTALIYKPWFIHPGLTFPASQTCTKGGILDAAGPGRCWWNGSHHELRSHIPNEKYMPCM